RRGGEAQGASAFRAHHADQVRAVADRRARHGDAPGHHDLRRQGGSWSLPVASSQYSRQVWVFSDPVPFGVTWAISTAQISGLSRAVQMICAMASLEIFRPLTKSRMRRPRVLSGSLRPPASAL